MECVRHALSIHMLDLTHIVLKYYIYSYIYISYADLNKDLLSIQSKKYYLDSSFDINVNSFHKFECK